MLVALESLALLVIAVARRVPLTGHVLPVAGIVFASVVLVGGALWLAAAARGVLGGMRSPRGRSRLRPSCSSWGLSFLQVALGGWGMALAVVAVVTILCLFAPPTVAFMHRTRDDAARSSPEHD
ncbi:hypothetical protein QJS66_22765 [Kocuria rhizophila]|nr:hypothetical protein QJS66_22765 [Kocuria rhizophila]